MVRIYLESYSEMKYFRNKLFLKLGVSKMKYFRHEVFLMVIRISLESYSEMKYFRNKVFLKSDVSEMKHKMSENEPTDNAKTNKYGRFTHIN